MKFIVPSPPLQCLLKKKFSPNSVRTTVSQTREYALQLLYNTSEELPHAKGDEQNRDRDMQCNQNLDERNLWHDPEQDGPARYWNTPRKQDNGNK